MSSVNWNARLSDIALNVKPSPIRALMKYTKTPGMISFAGGNPDPGYRARCADRRRRCLLAERKNRHEYRIYGYRQQFA